MGAGFILRPFFMRKIALGLENMAEGFRILFGYKIQIIFSVFFVSVLILPRRFYFFTKTMLGWIFFSIYIGAEFPKRSAWAEVQSLLLAIVHLLNLKKTAQTL